MKIYFMIAGFVAVLFFSYNSIALTAGWDDATCDPLAVDGPGACNVDKPINIGSTAQTKSGDLTIGGDVLINGANGLTVTEGVSVGSLYTEGNVTIASSSAQILIGIGATGVSVTSIEGAQTVTPKLCIGDPLVPANCITSLNAIQGSNFWKMTSLNDGIYASSTSWKVGIGTDTPTFKMHIVGDSTSGTLAFDRYVTSSSGSYSMYRTARGTSASPAVLQSGDEVGKLIFAGYNGSAFVQTGVIKDILTGSVSGANVPNALVFHVSATDANPSTAERMRITDTGLVGIGTTTPGYTLDVASNSGVRVKPLVNSASAVLRLESANTPGTGTGQSEVDFFDGTALGFRFLASFGNVASARYGGFLAYSDRDGNKLPLRFFTTDAAGGLQTSLFMEAGQTSGTAGNVGIGTFTPTSQLYINNTASNKTAVIINKATGQTSDLLQINTNNANPLRVDQFGTLIVNSNTGIQVNGNPSGSFNVISTAAGGHIYTFNSNSDGSFGMADNGLTSNPISSVNRWYINSAGNFGVGTVSPAYKLDVVGDVNISGTYRVNGVPIPSGGGGGTPGGSPNAVQFNNAGAFGGDVNNFYWNDASDFLGLGNSAPTQRIDMTGNLRLRAQGEVRLADNNSSNYVAFRAPNNVATDVLWTLPASDGTSGQMLSTNGNGTLSWTTVSGGGGGDITDVVAGTGLTGGAPSGSATLGLSNTGNLTSCTNANTSKLYWSGGALTCGTDATGGGAPTTAQYIVRTTDATLSNERVITAGNRISIADGGAGGNLTISLDSTGCSATEFLQWNGTSWVCAVPGGGGGGAVTSVQGALQQGITANPTNGSVLLYTDANILQRRISGACSSGSAITAINSDGTVTCTNSSPVPSGSKIGFVTSQTWSGGQIGSLNQSDTILCANAASSVVSKPWLSGRTWRAYLGDSTQSRVRACNTTYTYYDTNGNSLGTISDCNSRSLIISKFGVTENGATLDPRETWMGDTNNCVNWTSSNGAQTGYRYRYSGGILSFGNTGCDQTKSLICMEQ